MEHLIDKPSAASRDWSVIFETYQAAAHLYYLIKLGFSLGILRFLSSPQAPKFVQMPSILIRSIEDALN
jgi:hypothetical protein